MKHMAKQKADQDTETKHSELHELFLGELADILSAERQLTKALPKMAKAANSEELQTAFESHLVETENQIVRLEQVFTSLDEPVKSKECKAMKGLLEEGKELMEDIADAVLKRVQTLDDLFAPVLIVKQKLPSLETLTL